MNTEKYKTALLEEKIKIESELNRLGHKTHEQGDWVVLPDAGDGDRADAVDNADITEDYEEKIAVLGVLEERFRSLTNALSAIEDGSYGTCKTCASLIDPDRLEVNPATNMCLEHAE